MTCAPSFIISTTSESRTLNIDYAGELSTRTHLYGAHPIWVRRLQTLNCLLQIQYHWTSKKNLRVYSLEKAPWNLRMLMHLNQRCPNILVFALGQRWSQLQCPGIEKWEGLFAVRSSMGRTLGIVYPNRDSDFSAVTGPIFQPSPSLERCYTLPEGHSAISPELLHISSEDVDICHSAPGPIRNVGKVSLPLASSSRTNKSLNSGNVISKLLSECGKRNWNKKTIIRMAKRDADRNVKKDACASGENEYASHLDHKVADRCWNTGRGPLFRDIVSWAWLACWLENHGKCIWTVEAATRGWVL